MLFWSVFYLECTPSFIFNQLQTVHLAYITERRSKLCEQDTCLVQAQLRQAFAPLRLAVGILDVIIWRLGLNHFS